MELDVNAPVDRVHAGRVLAAETRATAPTDGSVSGAMRRTLNPLEIQALMHARDTVGVLSVAADAGVAEYTVRSALRGSRLNGATVRALALYLHAWEGATAHLHAA